MQGKPKIDLQRLRALIVEHTGAGKEFSRRSLSLAASDGKNPDLVRDLMRVDKRHPTFETAAGICAAVGVDISTVLKNINVNHQPDTMMIVTGAVQAGVWRERAEWPAEDRYDIDAGEPMLEGKRFGLVVEGRSMDKVLLPGMVLECVDIVDAGIEPDDGDYVIVERRQGDLYETTCKKLRLLDDGGFELVAESNQPEFADPIPIGKPDFNAPEDGAEIRVKAIVVRAHREMFRPRGGGR